MLARHQILNLIPHRGASFLLDHVTTWSDREILCGATSHLDPQNPLRRAGRLGAISGIEYGLQAAALHGALKGGAQPQPIGYVASLRGVEMAIEAFDNPAFGTLRVEATMEGGETAGALYAFRVLSEGHDLLVSGRATIVFTKTVSGGDTNIHVGKELS